MKLIFSKKGFDSTFGGQPSPIFPDGRMVSLPIPDKHSQCSYASIATPLPEYKSMLALLQALGCDRVKPSKSKAAMSEKICAHLDPDLNYDSKPRHLSWRPAFGQSGAAMGHLRNQGVGPGDIFLFYGLFDDAQYGDNGKLIYQGKPRQIIWGWMQVDELKFVPEITADPSYAWLSDHPHLMLSRTDTKNHIFIARQYLELPQVVNSLPGAGVFPFLRPELILSNPHGQSFAQWQLPAFFYPFPNKKPLTYHGNASQWKLQSESVLLNRPGGYGQEVVLDCEQYMPDVMLWLTNLVKHI